MNKPQQQEVLAAVLAMHDPEALNDQMVYEVWEDGEVTLTKGGDLYGQRNLHMIIPGCGGRRSMPRDALPLKNDCHSRIAVRTHEAAVTASNILKGYLTTTNRDFPSTESLNEAKRLGLKFAEADNAGTEEAAALASNALIEHLLTTGVINPDEAPRIWLGYDGFPPEEGAEPCHHVFVNITDELTSALVIACNI